MHDFIYSIRDYCSYYINIRKLCKTTLFIIMNCVYNRGEKRRVCVPSRIFARAKDLPLNNIQTGDSTVYLDQIISSLKIRHWSMENINFLRCTMAVHKVKESVYFLSLIIILSNNINIYGDLWHSLYRIKTNKLVKIY